MSTHPSEIERDEESIPEGSMFCQRCFEQTPVHMLWFKTIERGRGQMTVGQCVCDGCLDAAAASLEAARQLRLRLGQRPTLVRLALI